MACALVGEKETNETGQANGNDVWMCTTPALVRALQASSGRLWRRRTSNLPLHDLSAHVQAETNSIANPSPDPGDFRCTRRLAMK